MLYAYLQCMQLILKFIKLNLAFSMYIKIYLYITTNKEEMLTEIPVSHQTAFASIKSPVMPDMYSGS